MANFNGAPSYMKWLPSKTTATISRCEFMARGMVDGFISGRHRSPKKGFSVEFAEHREYVPGDDIRNIDWRVLARKDRYYIKQYMEETNLRATLLLDCSGSMAYTGGEAADFEGRPLSKLEYGKYLAAALAYMLVGQQDGVGLVTFDSKIRDFLPSKAMASQVRNILEYIDNSAPGGETALADIFNEVAERIPHRGVVIIISDLFDGIEPLLKALHHFRYRKHELILLHIMAEEEIHFPFDSFVHFKDLESPMEIQLDPKALRAIYLEQVNKFLTALKDGCGQMQADYVPISTKVPFDKSLSDYLGRRRTGIG
jgi:uncharacterized protein (DUF58 family)